MAMKKWISLLLGALLLLVTAFLLVVWIVTMR